MRTHRRRGFVGASALLCTALGAAGAGLAGAETAPGPSAVAVAGLDAGPAPRDGPAGGPPDGAASDESTACDAGPAAPVADAGATSTADSWDTAEVVENIIMKTRVSSGTAIREVYAETRLLGTVAEFRAVVVDVNSFHKFMPYVKESRIIRVDPDGAEYSYVQLDLPFPITARDYVNKNSMRGDPGPTGQGPFHKEWHTVANIVPERPGVIRLPRNEGYWDAYQVRPGVVHVKHGFVVDPGGAIPAWAANMSNRRGVPDMFKAIQREMIRRREEANRATKPAP